MGQLKGASMGNGITGSCSWGQGAPEDGEQEFTVLVGLLRGRSQPDRPCASGSVGWSNLGDNMRKPGRAWYDLWPTNCGDGVQNVRHRAEDPGALDVEDGVPPPRAAPPLLRRVVLSQSSCTS